MTANRNRNRRPAPPQEQAPPVSTELVIVRDNVPVPVEATVTDTATGKKVVFTPYQAHKATNQLRAAAGLERQIPPQMLYNYAKQAKFTTTIDPETGKWQVDLESFEAWVLPYIEKCVRVEARRTAA